MATERSLKEAAKCLEGVVLMEIFGGYSAPASAWPERPSKEELQDRIALALDAARADEGRASFRTLAEALHKFAPELSLELTQRWNVAKGEAEAALDEFLTAIRARAKEAGDADR